MIKKIKPYILTLSARNKNLMVIVLINEESSMVESQEGSNSNSSNYTGESDNLEKMILSTGIRVGTPVKTKYMTPFIVRANPEGLYILDISKTLAKIDVAANHRPG